MKKNTSWKMDESSVTFQSSVSGPGEFGHRKIVPNIFSIYLSAYCQRSCSCFQFFVIKKSVIPQKIQKTFLARFLWPMPIISLFSRGVGNIKDSKHHTKRQKTVFSRLCRKIQSKFYVFSYIRVEKIILLYTEI